MKLINKEEALFVLKSNSWNIDGWNKPIELRQAGLLANNMDYQRISELEMIEAIPIEWIINFAKTLTGYEQFQVSDITNQLLEDWRKENESNSSN